MSLHFKHSAVLCSQFPMPCRTRLRPRSVASHVMAYGIFPGAVVERGMDWRWGDQDGECIFMCMHACMCVYSVYDAVCI